MLEINNMMLFWGVKFWATLYSASKNKINGNGGGDDDSDNDVDKNENDARRTHA